METKVMCRKCNKRLCDEGENIIEIRFNKLEVVVKDGELVSVKCPRCAEVNLPPFLTKELDEDTGD